MKLSAKRPEGFPGAEAFPPVISFKRPVTRSKVPSFATLRGWVQVGEGQIA